jgi:hypothetical protein
MVKARSTYGREKCKKDFDGKAKERETTRKTYM